MKKILGTIVIIFFIIGFSKVCLADNTKDVSADSYKYDYEDIIIKKGNDLKLENTSLNLSNIFENYEYLADNALDLSCFIEDYKESQNSNYEEKDNKIIMNVQTKNENKYRQSKKLYIDKSTGNPLKMEITDINQNITVYILYNEVKINSLDKQNILAFRLYNTKQEI